MVGRGRLKKQSCGKAANLKVPKTAFQPLKQKLTTH
jgi:hypothetical protein